MEIINFEWWHVNLINAQEWQKDHINSESYIGIMGPTFTVVENAKPVACFGMQIQWPGRALVWAIVGDVKNWPAFHKNVKKRLDYFIKKQHVNRCEMVTEVGFNQASRWAEMLGFKKESVMSKYFQHGADAEMWVIA